MNKFEVIAPCHFGMEAVLKREITDLGYQITCVDNGKVTFMGEEDIVARANIFLRTTERILLKIGSFHAETFDELFEGVKDLPWERYLPKDAKFWVAKANSINSKLFSPSDIQRVVKKAMVDRLASHYHTEVFPETGASYPLRISIVKNEVTIGMDTTGTSLHKRGYRKFTAPAPVTETLAAALIMLTPWKAGRLLMDPFCGSGTIPIEAAMIAADIAPGMNREFTAIDWTSLIPANTWKEAYREAKDKVLPNPEEILIQGYDIDTGAVKMARENAKLAGVDKQIHFQTRDIADFNTHKKFGFVISNPPYGERLSGKNDLPQLYRIIGDIMKRAQTWSYYFLSGYEEAEKYIGKKATKNRKIYNGMIKTYYYQYIGIKPERR
ncbi:MAG: class I SAM-dependent RNA methyltransferase [Lachnoclostridium sp.]|jgi:putative N6-adenine-specific DNA methylase|nr:class I SAM-dependent RNA methyltransferase [Lachnoclostridium sp.]